MPNKKRFKKTKKQKIEEVLCALDKQSPWERYISLCGKDEYKVWDEWVKNNPGKSPFK